MAHLPKDVRAVAQGVIEEPLHNTMGSSCWIPGMTMCAMIGRVAARRSAMRPSLRSVVLPLVLALTLACSTDRPSSRAPDRASQPPDSSVPKRLTAVVMGDPPGFSSRLAPSGSGAVPGLDMLED